jgi:hypothetical protein
MSKEQLTFNITATINLCISGAGAVNDSAAGLATAPVK